MRQLNLFIFFCRALFQKLLKLQKLGTYNIKNITKN